MQVKNQATPGRRHPNTTELAGSLSWPAASRSGRLVKVAWSKFCSEASSIFTRKQIIGCACSPKEHGPGPMYPHPPPRRIGANFRGRLRQFHGSTTALRILGREAFVGQRPGGAATVRAAMAEREPAARSAGWSGHRSLRYCPHLGIVPHALNLGGSSALAFVSFSLHGRHVGGVRFR